ncbi:large conductance mechanosensitive channel protein MscL [Listeria monocytogenes]|jgi:large conductance mechanosensitive channel protein|uniref:Large-conductance mechanosensitive channel n=5 Tax=Listeria monocytogenes TaxID=1639 RepID=MSCL_LISMO|nr:large conductance mechanosensitive channel protein MscL [Listeria monocytogenes]NP_465588.1 large-conductance mechanosensitive channel protein [Listeria monocytogenes EGD-e]B8DH65.1 RecName: Full=Large-conductance mechanosensitive channel [Listeria monocytogenes HCC23]Q8Y5J6.1 RecName: Full=Large-conductance mechanosensitive channel [Listeria monocytogenes EGD-e]EAD5036222.1 large conductance mechanosensitive channel protein MscL [Listeria monocytogenes serotype 1/2a]EAE3701840.1 large cond
MKKMLVEFRDFALKGNVLDLAVAVVIGAAFGKIVSSLVDNIIMPLVGVLLGGLDFTDLSFKVGKSVIQYGAFIQSIVDFIIIAFAIFIFVKVLTSFIKKKEQTVEETPVPPTEEYLKEIRDLLKEQQK